MNVPLYEQLYNHVLSAIQTGQLRSGDRVPSEKELADKFDVSRITSKKALELLEQAGLIERIRGKGSFVRENLDLNAPILRRDESSGAPLGARPLIGVVLPDFSETYALRLVHAIEEHCSRQFYFVVIKRTYGSQDVEKEAVQALVTLGVSGLIVFPVHGEFYNPELLRLVIGGFPVVLIDRHLRGIPATSVTTDNVSAGQRLTAHLIERGLQHLAFVSPPAQDTSSIEERLEGYKAALAAADIPYRPNYVLTQLYSTLPAGMEDELVARDSETMTAFLEQNPQIEGIIASEYNLALVVRQTLQQLGLKQQVVCFDSPNSVLSEPLFTHIRQNEAAMGMIAVDQLLRQIGGERRNETILVDFQFIEKN
jgi:GntR family transcriptional regulator, arabinose operon transcriptional repressor